MTKRRKPMETRLFPSFLPPAASKAGLDEMINENLREIFDDAASEPIPREILDLVNHLHGRQQKH